MQPQVRYRAPRGGPAPSSSSFVVPTVKTRTKNQRSETDELASQELPKSLPFPADLSSEWSQFYKHTFSNNLLTADETLAKASCPIISITTTTEEQVPVPTVFLDMLTALPGQFRPVTLILSNFEETIRKKPMATRRVRTVNSASEAETTVFTLLDTSSFLSNKENVLASIPLRATNNYEDILPGPHVYTTPILDTDSVVVVHLERIVFTLDSRVDNNFGSSFMETVPEQPFVWMPPAIQRVLANYAQATSPLCTSKYSTLKPYMTLLCWFPQQDTKDEEQMELLSQKGNESRSAIVQLPGLFLLTFYMPQDEDEVLQQQPMPKTKTQPMTKTQRQKRQINTAADSSASSATNQQSAHPFKQHCYQDKTAASTVLLPLRMFTLMTKTSLSDISDLFRRTFGWQSMQLAISPATKEVCLVTTSCSTLSEDWYKNRKCVDLRNIQFVEDKYGTTTTQEEQAAALAYITRHFDELNQVDYSDLLNNNTFAADYGCPTLSEASHLAAALRNKVLTMTEITQVLGRSATFAYLLTWAVRIAKEGRKAQLPADELESHLFALNTCVNIWLSCVSTTCISASAPSNDDRRRLLEYMQKDARQFDFMLRTWSQDSRVWEFVEDHRLSAANRNRNSERLRFLGQSDLFQTVSFHQSQAPLFLSEDGALRLSEDSILSSLDVTRADTVIPSELLQTKEDVIHNRHGVVVQNTITFFGANSELYQQKQYRILQTMGTGMYGTALALEDPMAGLLMVMKEQAPDPLSRMQNDDSDEHPPQSMALPMETLEGTWMYWNDQHRCIVTSAEIMESLALYALEKYGFYDDDPNIRAPYLYSSFLCQTKAAPGVRMCTFLELVPSAITMSDWVQCGVRRDAIAIVRSRICAYKRFLYNRSGLRFFHNDLHDQNVLLIPSMDPTTMTIIIIDFGRCSFVLPIREFCTLTSTRNENMWQERCVGGGIMFVSFWSMHVAKAYRTAYGPVCSDKQVASRRPCDV